MSTTTPTATSSLSDLPTATGGTATRTPSSVLGKDEFMTLLTTQLKYQDPTQPVDNSQMIAQLAQFSQLEEIHGLSSKIDNMVTASAASSQLSTTQLVGKQALFKADRIGLTAGSASSFQLGLAETTADTTAVIADANGKVVRTLHLGPLSAGNRNIAWDGLDDSGQALPSGEYLLNVAGVKSDGTAVPADASVRATITGVTYENGVAELDIAGRHIPLADVLEISLHSAGT